MKFIKAILSTSVLMAVSGAFAAGTGYSTYPLSMEKTLIGAEFTGITSNGGGVGVQGRFTQRVNSKFNYDAGIGISGGQRSSRIFAGADYELFPDYENQPKISLKSTIQNSKDFDRRVNSVSLAPTVSKGFSFWGEEAFPFISLPYAINLDSQSSTYNTSFNVNVGITGKLPIEGYSNLIGMLEATVSVKDSFTGIFAGVSYPIN
ncbi:MAG: hypothetical protein COW00_13680 [Bdellovibrio sp. CG12_big_fil_rev_8_21_14_0_65_39_13]|nr:MAG: hypothetical protein COW78_07105 [Bdellovibrio sp. CG22_combo_CG10-13_8_21_14_all_39_27]PIQ58664.1 MAG: hypothetical protein COW00_13680 [Bdellovibrio sp. CG12_big_fil_rev_8_21_14_0_65_39_13]PIR33039.1 MAG: hypothetical protein COV37_18275 [Bdellovibrio sp. CG11_big_fil_rev_8_21_14_0_20_39_38]